MDIVCRLPLAPNCTFELGLLQHRHVLLHLIRRPQYDVDAEPPAAFGILLELAPTGAATQKQRAVLLELHRFRPVIRQMAQKRCAVARQRCQIRIRHALAHHRRVASGRVETRNAFLLDQQNIAHTAPREIIRGGGAGKSRTDDYDFVSMHLSTPSLSLTNYLKSESIPKGARMRKTRLRVGL